MKAKIHVKENSKPQFYRHRPVPYSMRKEVEKELDRLDKAGVIEPVQFSECMGGTELSIREMDVLSTACMPWVQKFTTCGILHCHIAYFGQSKEWTSLPLYKSVWVRTSQSIPTVTSGEASMVSGPAGRRNEELLLILLAPTNSEKEYLQA
jgi:hypothetical protein